MKRKKLLVISAIALTTVYSAYKLFHHDNTAQQNAVIVKAATVQEQTLPNEIHAIATLSARSVQITPEIAGHVDAVLFKDGSEVKAGTVLVQLDDAVPKARYASAQAKLNFSQNTYNRLALLGKKGVVAQQAIDQAEADLKENKAITDENAVMLSKMKLLAPFDGMVGKSLVNPGDYVNVGQAIVSITDTRHLRIEYSVPEKYLPVLKIGQDVKVTSGAYPGKSFSGKLNFISPTVNPDNRSIALYADIDNNQNLLAAGMFVDASQSLGATDHALMVPARSLVPVLDGAQVFKVVDGKAVAVNVTLGQRTPESVEITQGLSKGDTVITDGQMKIKNGMPVKILS